MLHLTSQYRFSALGLGLLVTATLAACSDTNPSSPGDLGSSSDGPSSGTLSITDVVPPVAAIAGGTSITIYGAGVIGCEYASIFAALGISKVTIIEGRDRLLGFLDPEIGDILTASFRRLGMEVILRDKIVKYDKPSSGRGVKVTLESGRVLAAGPTSATLTAENIRALYDIDADVSFHDRAGHLTVVPLGAQH